MLYEHVALVVQLLKFESLLLLLKDLHALLVQLRHLVLLSILLL